MKVADRIYDTVASHRLISSGDCVIAGLSGGADSVCLLLVLLELSVKMGFSLRAVHVNHCLRGSESDSDEEFCRKLCRRKNIPLSVYRVDVTGFADKTGASVEEAARSLRYDAFFKEAEKFPHSKIATAHNRCDNSETVIFNIARGTGIKGICGIPYRRGRIIRPLLDTERSEIEEYLRETGQDFVTDSSNLSNDYSRNKIRHCVIPTLLEINSGFFESTARLSRSAAEDEEYFEELLCGIPPEEVWKYPPSVRKRYIRRLLSENSIPVSCERLCEFDEAMKSRKSVKYSVGKDMYAVFAEGTVTVRRIPKPDIKDICVRAELSFDGETDLPEIDKTVKITRACDDILVGGRIIHKNLTNNCLDCAKIQGVAVIRNKRSGDSISFKGKNFTTKLKKLYNAMKLSPNERMTALVAEDSEGIFWSEYGGVSGRVFPDAASLAKDICLISVTRR